MDPFSLLESWLIQKAGFWILTRRKERDLGVTALLPPASSAAAPQVTKTKTPRSLTDILEDSGLSTTLSPFRGVNLFRARSRLVLHETSKSLYRGDLGYLVDN